MTAPVKGLLASLVDRRVIKWPLLYIISTSVAAYSLVQIMQGLIQCIVLLLVSVGGVAISASWLTQVLQLNVREDR